MRAGRPLDDIVVRLRAAGCVFAEDEAVLLADAATGTGVPLDELVERRVSGEPLEQVVGWVEFCGLRLAVAPGVFVPRVRTEALALAAADVAREVRDGAGDAVVVDLCCGVGAIGAVVLDRAAGDIRLFAADLDPAAVAVARRNLEPRGGVVLGGDLFTPLPGSIRGRVDVLAVNAPYVPTAAIATMPPEARDHEARLALDGGADGLDLHRRIAAEASGWLRPGGRLLIETSAGQADRTAGLFEVAGLSTAVLRDDDRDATVVIASRAGEADADVVVTRPAAAPADG